MRPLAKGKPVERRGRKATGLRDVSHDSGVASVQRRTRTKSAPPGVRAAIVVAVTVLAPALTAGAGDTPGTNQTATDFALKGLDGHNLRLSEYRGDPVVLTFWASWCGPCRESLITLDRVAASTGVPVLGVNIEGQQDRAASIASSLNLHFPTLLDTQQAVARTYDVNHLPLTLLIDRDGRVRASWSGMAIEAQDLTREVAGLTATR
jgi:peroxiredoxin